jgi:hypothetical protein
MPDKEYTQRDFAHIGLQADALKDFADLLDHNYDRQADGTMPASIALIIKTLIEPVNDFLAWTDDHVKIPETAVYPDGDEEEE